ncbi:MAG: hypothetical protein UT20_C0002G0017 [Candidatus Levybacteria bacterium GW2011_GWA1_39_11]|nr:MAG: hypothetical protein UT20_C0002G0017 [Candidatus Levybacteria bacterium GW2011_GWA1_39_11]KKR27014.1 MAG: hypothetical protein UT57_C0022G0006 [Microgenomates group bacterium GW2011_GWC1_39_7]
MLNCLYESRNFWKSYPSFGNLHLVFDMEGTRLVENGKPFSEKLVYRNPRIEYSWNT